MLAIVGGSGRLPDILAEALPGSARYAPAGIQFGGGELPAEAFRFEKLGDLINRLARAGARQVVFAGAIRRPRFDPTSLDDFTREAMQRIGPALALGDDALLRSVIAVFEGAGFDVVAAHEAVPSLIPPAGVATSRGPGDGDADDARRGFSILAALGPFDVGQACVVAGGQALAIEALGGTDWMLETLAGPHSWRPGGGRGGVLCKAPKPSQDRRADLPAIGPETVAAARAARLGGIAIEAGGVMVLDREHTVAAADEAGMFLWSVEH